MTGPNRQSVLRAARTVAIASVIAAQMIAPAATVAEAVPLPAPVQIAQSGQDRAQEAVRKGLILPLRTIIGTISGSYHGRQLGAQLSEQGRNRWIYTVKWITPKRDVLHFVVNAQNAQIINVRGRGAAAARK